MANKFIGQRKWVQQVLTEFSELDQGLPDLCDSDSDWPDWVYELLLRLMPISHPGTKFKNNKRWKARELGRFLGRQYAGEFMIQGKVQLTGSTIRDAEKFAAWFDDFIRRRASDFNQSAFSQRMAARGKLWRPRFQKFIQETLAAVCERPYIEARDFFEAYGKAIVMKPDEFETERTLGVGDKICWVMFLQWRDIEKLQSISQLHSVFEKALKPHGITVKYKRIEKLCQRIKLRFREGGGRPKGSQNSDKSPRALGVISRN
jgi:hypothetical protein